MSILLYVVGVAIGVSVFLYFLHALDSGKKKIMRISASEKTVTARPSTKNTSAGREQQFSSLKKAHPGERICPLCGSVLTRHEPLYASRYERGNAKKILIHGCRYCFKPEKSDEWID